VANLTSLCLINKTSLWAKRTTSLWTNIQNFTKRRRMLVKSINTAKENGNNKSKET
jgi:hypothetical protein